MFRDNYTVIPNVSLDHYALKHTNPICNFLHLDDCDKQPEIAFSAENTKCA